MQSPTHTHNCSRCGKNVYNLEGVSNCGNEPCYLKINDSADDLANDYGWIVPQSNDPETINEHQGIIQTVRE
jgi:hypothetical protein